MNVHIIDHYHLGYPHVIASYVLESSLGPILIETGPRPTLPNVLQGLANLGLKPDDIRHIFVTHIHLDHAGAAGWWAAQGAQIYVHPVGAPHLIDPTKLIQSAARIYGDQMERLWGEILPVPADKVTILPDNATVTLGDITLTAWDTPGHATHHHALVVDDWAFIGDLGGVRLPNTTWISVTAPPPEFQLESWYRSLDRVEAAGLRRIYPTHYGPVDDVAAHLIGIRRELENSAEFIRQHLLLGVERHDLIALYTQWSREQALTAGVPDEVFAQYEAANPLFMSVDGITRYWRKMGLSQ